MNIQELILKEIDKQHEKDNLRNIAGNRERLLNDLLAKRRYEVRNGKITNQNGVLQNIAEDVELLIDSSPYIGRRVSAADDAKFVSKFIKPDADTKKKFAAEVEGVLKKLVKFHAIIPKDEDNFNRAITEISKNFLYETADSDGPIDPHTGKPEYREGEVIFAKMNDNGLTGDRRLTFRNIENSLSHLIDNERTQFARALRESELKALAKKIVGDIPKDRVRTSVDPIKEQVETIKRNEMLSTFTRKQLPRLPKSEIEKEIKRRESVVRGWGELDAVLNSGNSMRLSALNRIAKYEIDSLDDLTPINNVLQKIQPQGPAKFEGISYE